MYAVFTSTEGTPLANFIYLGDKQGELWVWITRTSKQTDLGLCAFRECPAALRYSVWRDGIGIGCCRTARLLMARASRATRMKSKFAAFYVSPTNRNEPPPYPAPPAAPPAPTSPNRRAGARGVSRKVRGWCWHDTAAPPSCGVARGDAKGPRGDPSELQMLFS